MTEDALAVEVEDQENVQLSNVEHGSQQWFELMAKLMKRRERAVASVKRWQDVLATAEENIAALSSAATLDEEASPTG
jgi:hypothetical protein